MEGLSLGTVLVGSAQLMAVLLMGYGTRRAGWFPDSAFGVLSTIVVRITLPATLLSIANTLELGTQTLILIAAGFLVTLLLQVAGRVVTHRRPATDRGFAVINTSGYNVALFAMPYLAGVLGPAALVPALAFDVGNGTSTSGPGYAWGVTTSRPDLTVTVLSVIRQLLRSPVFVTYLVIMSIRGAGLVLPGPVVDFTALIGQANVFLAMFMLGVGLRFRLPRERYSLAVLLLVTRYAVAIAAALATWFLVPLDVFERTVLCTMYFAPLPAMASAFTHDARGDVELSTFIISATILVGLVAMPAVLLLLS